MYLQLCSQQMTLQQQQHTFTAPFRLETTQGAFTTQSSFLSVTNTVMNRVWAWYPGQDRNTTRIDGGKLCKSDGNGCCKFFHPEEAGTLDD